MSATRPPPQNATVAAEAIPSLIHSLRGQRVILDRDLAQIYQVTTKALNQAVKRNPAKFPPEFAFPVTARELAGLRSQIVTESTPDLDMRSQNVTAFDSLNRSRSQNVTASQSRRNTKVTPYAFNEQGVAMLSGILNSERAINMNIAIMRAFVEVRRILLQSNDLKEQLKLVKQTLGEHDAQLNQIYDALENLLDEKAAQKKWDQRERIGFKK